MCIRRTCARVYIYIEYFCSGSQISLFSRPYFTFGPNTHTHYARARGNPKNVTVKPVKRARIIFLKTKKNFPPFFYDLRPRTARGRYVRLVRRLRRTYVLLLLNVKCPLGQQVFVTSAYRFRCRRRRFLRARTHEHNTGGGRRDASRTDL